jgi:hypothetical protein
MENQTKERQMLIGTVRWTARILSILSIAGLGIFMIGEQFDPFRLQPFELLEFVFFPLGVIGGLMIAWRHEALGGVISLGSFVIFYLLNYAKAGRFPRGWAFFGFSIPAILFLLNWLQIKKKEHSAA